MKLKKHQKIAIVMGSQSDFSTMKDCIKILKNDRKLNVIEVETSNLTYKFYEKLNFKIEYIKKEYWPNNDDLYFMKIDLI